MWNSQRSSMDLFPEHVALATRVVVFVALLGSFSRGLLPLSMKFAVGACLFLALVPNVPTESSDGEVLYSTLRTINISFAHGTSLPGIFAVRLLYEVAVGGLLAVAAGAGIFAAEFFASWISRLIFPGMPAGVAERSTLHAAICLIGVRILLDAPGLGQLWRFFAETCALNFTQMQTAGTAEALKLVIAAGSGSFVIAGALLIPFFLCSVLFDVLHVLGKRYTTEVFNGQFAIGAKAVVLLMLLAASIFSIAAVLSTTHARAIADRSFRISTMKSTSINP